MIFWLSSLVCDTLFTCFCTRALIHVVSIDLDVWVRDDFTSVPFFPTRDILSCNWEFVSATVSLIWWSNFSIGTDICNLILDGKLHLKKETFHVMSKWGTFSVLYKRLTTWEKRVAQPAVKFRISEVVTAFSKEGSLCYLIITNWASKHFLRIAMHYSFLMLV